MSILASPDDQCPALQTKPSRRTTWRLWAVSVALCTLLLVSLVCLVGTIQSGSMDVFLQRANGEELVVQFDPPDLAQPGILYKNDDGKTFVRVPVNVLNFSPTARNLLGGMSNCQCVTTGQLPQRVESGERGSIDVIIRVEPNELAIDHVVTLYTDSPVNSVLTFRVASRGH